MAPVVLVLSACNGLSAFFGGPVPAQEGPEAHAPAVTLLPADLVRACDGGHTSTAWASACPARNMYSCVEGAWGVVDPGGMPPVGYETPHFALRWNGSTVTAAQAAATGAALEAIWTNHVDSMGFLPPFCRESAKHKVNVYIDPSFGLSGSGTGDHDPAMWISPGALNDHWGLAHEFAHALQFASRGLRDSAYVGWFWESHAQFMAHSLPEFHNSSMGYDCSVYLANFPHIYYGSTRDRYCNFQFLDFVRDRFCAQAVAKMWSEALPPENPNHLQEDPFKVLARTMRWSTPELNDFFIEWAMHNVTWDYRDPDGTDQGPAYRAGYGPITDRAGGGGANRLRTTLLDPLTATAHPTRFVTPPTWAPQRWGYNVVQLFAVPGSSHVTVTFRGVVQDGPATTTFGPYQNQPASIPAPHSDWRWGLVAVGADGVTPRYGEVQRGSDASTTFCVDPNDSQLFLVVMATPSEAQQILWDQMYYTIYRYPWMVELAGALPEGFQPHAPNPSAQGERWPYGGGWVEAGASVAPGVFIGPNAGVFGSSQVLGQARIEDHAAVVNATVKDTAVIAGISILMNGITVSGQARANSAFAPLGFFEGGQTLSGTAQLIGDIEYHDNTGAGVYYGAIGVAQYNDPSQGSTRTAPVPEVTAPPPYVWRP